jgi:hypothetical protein
MGQLTIISMVIFNSYVTDYHGWYPILIHIPVVPLTCLRTQWIKQGVGVTPSTRAWPTARKSIGNGRNGWRLGAPKVAMVYGSWRSPRKIEFGKILLTFRGKSNLFDSFLGLYTY